MEMKDGPEDIEEMVLAVFEVLANRDASMAMGIASLIEVIARTCEMEKLNREKIIEAMTYRLAIGKSPPAH